MDYKLTFASFSSLNRTRKAVKLLSALDNVKNDFKRPALTMNHISESIIKVGTHEGTSRRDLFQGLVLCRIYTMGQVAGTSPLKGLHAGTCYT